jgi:hypothetical protein
VQAIKRDETKYGNKKKKKKMRAREKLEKGNLVTSNSLAKKGDI